MGTLRRSLWLLLLLCGCQSWSDARTRADWAALQAAETDEDKLNAARDLCQDDVTPIADKLAGTLGAYSGTDAEAYLAVALAKVRPNGMHWLAKRFYGTSLDDAYADLFDPDAIQGGRLDWPPLADALMIGPLDSAEADRWLAFMAIADDGTSTAIVRSSLGTHDVRVRIREALSRADMPKLLPSPLLLALGAPRDDAETLWLKSRYQTALEESIENRTIEDNFEFEALKSGWEEAFPDEPLPLPPRDREIMRVLRPLLAPDDAPDVPPSFDEIASFMLRHERTGWLRVVQIYADGFALPSNALSYVCRASASECGTVLQSGVVKDIASAADVAPALDLEGGDSALDIACSELPQPEARQLAARASGAGMPLHTRESGAACLASLGDDVTALWKQLLPEALAAHSWRDAEMIAAISRDSIDPALRSNMIEAVKRGEVSPLDVPWLLVDDDEGAALVQQSILNADPNAFDGLGSGAIRGSLAPIAEHVRAPREYRRMARIEDSIIVE